MEFFVVFGIIILFIGFSMVKLVPQNQVAIVELFGKYERTLNAGLNFLVPVLERVSVQVNLAVCETFCSSWMLFLKIKYKFD